MKAEIDKLIILANEYVAFFKGKEYGWKTLSGVSSDFEWSDRNMLTIEVFISSSCSVVFGGVEVDFIKDKVCIPFNYDVNDLICVIRTSENYLEHIKQSYIVSDKAKRIFELEIELKKLKAN